MKVEMGKNYKNRRGVEVRILAVDLANAPYTVAGFIKGCGLYSYTSDGRFCTSIHSPEDLVEVCEWADFQPDDKVMVKMHSNAYWCKRYFAGVNSKDKPTTFHGGNTSWSNVDTLAVWDECRKPTEEEAA